MTGAADTRRSKSRRRWPVSVALLALGVIVLAIGVVAGAAWLLIAGCVLIAAAPMVALWRVLNYTYKPKRVYDRSFLADVLGTSSEPHYRGDGDPGSGTGRESDPGTEPRS
jgi:hypothetical protein